MKNKLMMNLLGIATIVLILVQLYFAVTMWLKIWPYDPEKPNQKSDALKDEKGSGTITFRKVE